MESLKEKKMESSTPRSAIVTGPDNDGPFDRSVGSCFQEENEIKYNNDKNNK